MWKRTISGMVLTLFLMGMLTLAFNVQPVKSDWTWTETIYIRADGSVEPSDAPISSADNITYTLTDNIVGNVIESSSAIAIERDNIVVDGAGYTVQGTASYDSRGIYLTGRSNVTIKNMEVREFYYGIYFHSSSSNTVSGNNIATNNSVGIRLSWSNYNTVSGNIVKNNGDDGIYLHESSSNTISENNIKNNEDGIRLERSFNNAFSGNNITNNTGFGILIHWESSNNVFRNNIMAGNSYNFGVDSFTLEGYIHDVDVSNTVDGKPMYYLVNQKNLVIDPFTYSNIGYLALINSTNITVKGLELKNNMKGLLFAYTNNSQITNNNITKNLLGIVLQSSSNNTVFDNKITENNRCGIYLCYSSNYNIIFGNNIKNNQYGIQLTSSSIYNSISGNNVTNNRCGIYLCYSSNYNIIFGNNITNNQYGIRLGYASSNNVIYHNNFVDNTQQVYIETSGYANFWDDGYPSGGNYWGDYNGTDFCVGPYQNETGSDGIGDVRYTIDENNTDHYPLMKPYRGPYDIGITSFTTSKSVVGQGYCLNVTIKALNYGISTETFNVTAYANTTIIATFTDITLTSRNSTILTFTWNTTGFTKANYTISAYAWPVLGETDTSDNTLVGGKICVSIPGDVDGDFDVDLYDAVKLLVCYGAKKGHPKYDPNCDIDGDGNIDLYDAVRLLKHYGQKDP